MKVITKCELYIMKLQKKLLGGLPMTANQELQIMRTFDVPKETLFNMWTQPNHLKHWWAPIGFTVEIASIELESGGTFHYSQTSADGQTLWGKFVFREIENPNRLVFVNSFSDEMAKTVRAPFHPNWPLEILNKLIFTESKGKTTLMMQGIPISASEEEQALFRASHEGIKQGFTGTFDKLESYLEELKEYVKMD